MRVWVFILTLLFCRMEEKQMVIELKNEQLTVQFSKLGGALTSIKDKDGMEYLWQGDPEYWSGQAPVLFPICGSVRNDRVLFKELGVEGAIPRHGLVRKKEFQLEQQTKDSVTFATTYNDETLQAYPYRFKLSITYTLSASTIRTTYLVTNLEKDKSLPYFIGVHPGFNCPLLEDETYEDYYLEFDQAETCSVPKQFPETGLLDVVERRPFLENQNILPLTYELFSHDAITLDQLQSRAVTLRSKNHDKGLRLEFQDFPNLILWSTINQGPFIALEPWSGLSTSLEESDVFSEKPDVTWVKEGSSDSKSFDIRII